MTAPEIVDVTPEAGWRLRLRFADDADVTVRFDPGYFVGVWEPLGDPRLFNQACAKRGVIVWPGGVELTAEALSHRVKHRGEWVLFSPQRDALA